MLNYMLEERENAPIYEYLYQCIRRDIRSGAIPAGSKLPSKRELARRLGIAVITVENAYAQLLVEGYIYSKPKSGYFAGDLQEIVKNPDTRRAFKQGTKEVLKQGTKENLKEDSKENSKEDLKEASGAATSAASRGNEAYYREKRLEAQTQNVMQQPLIEDFTSNRLQEDSFPFATWTKLMRRELADHELDFLNSPPAEGVRELREAIADYLSEIKGLVADPSCIIIGPGTEYLHHLLLQIIGRCRQVAVEDPGYNKVAQIYESNGMRVLHIPVDEKGMRVDQLQRSNASLIHISPSHHFPTGCVMPAERRHQLLAFAALQDTDVANAFIVEDDYDSEFRLEGRPISTLASLDPDHVIYMNTFSRTLAPSIRIAYMLLPQELMERFRKKLYFYSSTVSAFEQYTLAVFLKRGYYERHVNRMRNYYRDLRKNFLEKMQASRLGEMVSLEEDRAGLHFVLLIHRNINDEKFTELLESKGVKIAPVSLYCYNNKSDYAHRFVIRYTAVSMEQLDAAFEIMAETIQETEEIDV